MVLAALFTENAEKIRGKHPISTKEIRRAAELGAEIATQARSASTPKDRKRVGEAKAAADLRDRIYTLSWSPPKRLGGRGGEAIMVARCTPLMRCMAQGKDALFAAGSARAAGPSGLHGLNPEAGFDRPHAGAT